MQHFIIGDIHGCRDKLTALILKMNSIAHSDDVFVFCGDYIDRGRDSFDTVELLFSFSRDHTCVFLTGNHEILLQGYLSGDHDMSSAYLANGGFFTIRSYHREFGNLFIPESHASILFGQKYLYEGSDFIVVHAGLDPSLLNPMETSPFDCVWLREKFYNSGKIWEKTVIFGHTPTHLIGLQLGEVFIDDRSHLIGIDTGAVYGGALTCLIWPDRRIIQV